MRRAASGAGQRWRLFRFVERRQQRVERLGRHQGRGLARENPPRRLDRRAQHEARRAYMRDRRSLVDELVAGGVGPNSPALGLHGHDHSFVDALRCTALVRRMASKLDRRIDDRPRHRRRLVGRTCRLVLADSRPRRRGPLGFAHFRRVLRPGAPLLLSFHVGDESRLKTRGYGGHPMNVYVHRVSPAAWPPGSTKRASWLRRR